MSYTILDNGKTVATINDEKLAAVIFMAAIDSTCGAGESLTLRYDGPSR